MLKKLFLLLTLSIVFPALTIFGQKPEQNEEGPVPQRETREERPSEPPKEAPKQVETSRQVETPRAEPKQTENKREDNKREERRQSDNSSNNNNESRQRPNRKDNDSDSDRQRQNRKPKDDDDVNRPKRPRNSERPPVENPNLPVNPNPQPVENNNNNQGRNRNKDKDDKDRDDKRRNRNNNGSWEDYSIPTNYPSTPSSNPTAFSLSAYFDKDDVFFDVYNTYVDAQENYLPFFDDSPDFAFQPLYYSYGRKFFRNEFPFVADDWTIYYEPDLDDIYVDFSKLGQIKYERMVMYPIGETIKKASKKFNYKGNDVRPVLVEKIPDIEQDKIYSFNVHDLPKGDYELRLIAKDGSTVKHSIRIK